VLSIWPDIILLLSLAYFNAGMNLLLFHTGLSPMDQPGYVERGLAPILIAALLWPITARINRELAWFFVIFVAAVLVFALGWLVLGVLFYSPTWRAVTLLVVSFTGLFGRPSGFLGSLIWRAVAKPLGLRVPLGLERMLLRTALRNAAP
jgi:hypothetical protein